MDFDPTAYLSMLDPGVTYDISRLTNGLINFTFRATKATHSHGRSRFPDHSSLILKYAPPYMAGIGVTAPAPQKRQSIEALALSLFHSLEPGPLAYLCNESSVRVPQCLHHDSNAHVLVMSDLGALPDLSQIFADLGGQIEYPELGPGIADANKQVTPATMVDVMPFEQLGAKLGKFFAGLHSKETRRTVLARHPRREFENPQMRAIVLTHAIEPVLGYLKIFPDLISDEEAEHLFSLVIDDFERNEPVEELSFVLGDCWTSAVLSNIHDQTGVIDWEFASFGRGPHGDMAQLLVHLELLRITAGQDDGKHFPNHLRNITMLLKGLTSAYVDTISSLSSIDNHPDMEATISRSTRLTYGAEIINCAFRKTWRCVAPSCQCRDDHGSEAHKCVLVRRMVEHGLWYLRHADENTQATLWPNYEGITWSMSLQDSKMAKRRVSNAVIPCAMSGHNVLSNASVVSRLAGESM